MELTRELIRSLCTKSSFDRGKNYYSEGRVKIIEYNQSQVRAKVTGSSDYKVEIDLDDLDAKCSCPYDWGGYCKHIIATLLSVKSDDIELKAENDNQENITAILERISYEELKKFVAEECKRDDDFKSRFLIYFGEQQDSLSLYDYKKEVDLLYKEAGDRTGFVDYYNEVKEL